ncbi:MAG: FkbM family methyltransferase [Planctomycetota bacterium]|nr:FkbM family methyltransferase [Planctomycetota bacterium]
MSTPRVQHVPRLIPELLKLPALKDSGFFLVDVGASGGVEPFWNAFGDALHAVGFDVLVNEVARLNKENKNERIRYVDGVVTCPADVVLPTYRSEEERIRVKHTHLESRSSDRHALKRMNVDYIKKEFNANQEVVVSERRVTLDEFFAQQNPAKIDFIKVDTDGHDFPVLLGAEKILRQGDVLGLSVEAQLHGMPHEKANLFANIDTFLRSMGYTLFDLEIFRYSRADLPAQFCHDIPAQTVQGQVFWGEAVYFRDLGGPDYEKMWKHEPAEAKVVKLAALYELFGLNDCAAELIKKFRGRFFTEEMAGRFLDQLTPVLYGKKVGYAKYMQAFEQDPKSFYASQFASTFGGLAEPNPHGDSASAGEATAPLYDPVLYHRSGRPRSKTGLSLRGLKRALRSFFGS